MNILLHICCAPCSLYTIDKLRQDRHKVQGFFYNPNVYPSEEYKLRRQAVVDMVKRMDMDVVYKDVGAYLCVRPSKGKHTGLPLPKQHRCANCWRMRLSEASRAAKSAEHDAFTTTLLISPYQDHEQIKVIGNELGKEAKVDFYYNDFRVGFRQSQQKARESCYYRQKYCGCEASINERSR